MKKVEQIMSIRKDMVQTVIERKLNTIWPYLQNRRWKADKEDHAQSIERRKHQRKVSVDRQY